METIVRNVNDLPAVDRSAAERLVGHELASNQQLVIVVKNQVGHVAVPELSSTPQLPEWCNVYRGLSDKEVDDLEKSILARADLSRTHS